MCLEHNPMPKQDLLIEIRLMADIFIALKCFGTIAAIQKTRLQLISNRICSMLKQHQLILTHAQWMNVLTEVSKFCLVFLFCFVRWISSFARKSLGRSDFCDFVSSFSAAPCRVCVDAPLLLTQSNPGLAISSRYNPIRHRVLIFLDTADWVCSMLQQACHLHKT